MEGNNLKNLLLKLFGIVLSLEFLSIMIVNPIQAATDARRGGPGGIRSLQLAIVGQPCSLASETMDFFDQGEA